MTEHPKKKVKHKKMKQKMKRTITNELKNNKGRKT
jgi:hypothetical protein